MNSSLNIHPDFRSIKGRALSFNRWPLALMTSLLATVNALHRRKFKTIINVETIPGLGGYRIPLLNIKPENRAPPSPALIYCHGGAFVMKHAPQHLENAVRYAREAGCTVIFVDYRLAPQCPFPAGFNDCYSALQWAASNAEDLGIDKQRIAVGGDSAGGAMAAAAVQRAIHEDGIRLCGQMLIYPVVDAQCRRQSSSAYVNVPPFKAASPTAMWQAYLGHAPSAGAPRYASPLDGNLSGLAPAYVELAEFDLLHDQGHAYAEAMLAAGVDVELNEIRGTVHGFDLLAAQSGISRAALHSRIQFLRKIFAA
jgi:acetyl esterase